MIHFRKTVQIAPGRQADAVARAHEWAKTYKDSNGIDARVTVVTTGTLGRLCWSADYESMGAKEEADAKWGHTHPRRRSARSRIRKSVTAVIRSLSPPTTSTGGTPDPRIY